MFDIKGRMVFYGKQPKDKTATTIPVTDLAKGFYVIRVINGAETQVAKFIKD